MRPHNSRDARAPAALSRVLRLIKQDWVKKNRVHLMCINLIYFILDKFNNVEHLISGTKTWCKPIFQCNIFLMCTCKLVKIMTLLFLLTSYILQFFAQNPRLKIWNGLRIPNLFERLYDPKSINVALFTCFTTLHIVQRPWR